MGKIRMAVQDAKCRVLYLFRPATVIVTCLLVMILADAIGIILLCRFHEGIAHEVILALITGITASVLVAVIIEMANNYQRNSKRWILLSQFFSSLTHYSSHLDVLTGHFDTHRAHVDMMTTIHEHQVAEGTETEEEARAAIESASDAFTEDGDDADLAEHRDRVRCVFSMLPDIIPQVKEAYHDYEADFSRQELESMGLILSDYGQIENLVEMAVMELSTIQYGRDPKNPGTLVTDIPPRVKNDLSDSILRILAENERAAERQRITEAILNEGWAGLSSLGITISEELSKGELEDEGSDDEDIDTLTGITISRLISGIDHELLNLQKIIKSEPGFGTFYTFAERHHKKYLR